MQTVGDIKTRIRQEMEQNSDSTTYNSQRLLDMINEVGQEIREGKVSNELTNLYIQGNVLDFATSKFVVSPIDNLPINAPITTSSTEIEIDTTNLPTTGGILLWNEIISYTGKTATEITGVTGILSDHSIGEFAIILHKLPTNFRKPLKVYNFISQQEIEIQMKDSINNQYKYYEILDWYIYFYGTSKDKIYIKYTTNYEYLTDDTDPSPFPDSIALNILPFIAGGRMIKDEVLRVKLLTQWYNKIATEYTRQWEKTGKPKGMGRKRFWFNSVN
mgnify:CR=1 FL=1